MKYNTLPLLLTLWMAAAGMMILSPCLRAEQTYDYAAIDRHALDTPADAESSIRSLAAHLTKPARNDREKARAIYRWITNNISYDVQSLNRARTAADRSRSAEDTLKTRGAVCAGYSQLFTQLATAAGLRAVEVDGTARGLVYSPDRPGQNLSGHAWNAVSIDGKWRLVDSAWGAGYINRQGQYVREFDEHFFLTRPEDFIYDHFPTESKWQCLDKPISEEEFYDLPNVGPAFFHNSIKLVSQRQAVIKAEDSVMLTLSAPEDVLLMAKLTSDMRVDRQLAIAQREGDQYRIYAALPKPGKYTLQVFSKRADDRDQYALTLYYTIQASKGAGEGVGFPEVLASFSERNGCIHMPLEGRLQAGGVYPFRIQAPGAEEVAVISGGDWTHLTKKKDTFEGKVIPGSGRVKVAARYPGQKEYSVLLEYQADERPAPRLPAALAITR